MRILVAEDERINQLYMKHLLTSAGHDVVIASDGREAIDRLASAPCGLVLMDLQMPEMGGLEAARRIRAGEAGAASSDVPIVALTAYSADDDQLQQPDVGLVRILEKPIVEAGLLDLVDEIASRENT